MTIKDLIRREN